MGDSPNHIISILVNHKETIVVVWFLIVSFILYRACRDGSIESSTRSHRSRSVQEEIRRRSIMGLDWETLNALPVFVYKSHIVKEKLECSICLSELAENEMCRLLPNCNHSFHTECIDMWLFSHNSCPLCRTNALPSTNAQSLTNAGPSNATNSENVEGDIGGNNALAEEIPSSSNAASSNTNAGNGHPITDHRRFRFSNPPRLLFWMDHGSSGVRTLPQIVIHIPTGA